MKNLTFHKCAQRTLWYAYSQYNFYWQYHCSLHHLYRGYKSIHLSHLCRFVTDLKGLTKMGHEENKKVAVSIYSKPYSRKSTGSSLFSPKSLKNLDFSYSDFSYLIRKKCYLPPKATNKKPSENIICKRSIFQSLLHVKLYIHIS